jgi:uncharacterized lipoprotein NlpE involved in copper resistance
MRIKIAVVAIIGAAICLSGFFSNAATPRANPTAPDQHTSENSLDWQGTYAGVVPCADCEGIETTLTINKDLSYLLKTKYLGKDNKVLERRGTFTWEKNGQVINLKGLSESPNRYFVGENQLWQLSMQGEKITGKRAEKYILRKKGSGAAGS